MYRCERCGYSSEYKSNLKNHFKRKNPCNSTYRERCLGSLLEEINQISENVNNVNNVNTNTNSVNTNTNSVNNIVLHATTPLKEFLIPATVINMVFLLVLSLFNSRNNLFVYLCTLQTYLL